MILFGLLFILCIVLLLYGVGRRIYEFFCPPTVDPIYWYVPDPDRVRIDESSLPVLKEYVPARDLYVIKGGKS